MKTNLKTYKTPCNKYQYLSYGLEGSIQKNKDMLEFCKDHCKIEMCLMLKEFVLLFGGNTNF